MAAAKRQARPRNPESIPFSIHPRAFKALGADLVTNDVVAIIELVKNAYDAYATEVEIRFRDDSEGQVLEIEDNGSGMSFDVIEEAWCTVATPFRTENPIAKKPGKRNRRTSGAKGLGRLSAARLGARLFMVTQTRDGESWEVEVDWDELSQCDSLDECVVQIALCEFPPFDRSGTLLRISPLRASWTEPVIDDLRDNLARLLPPFDDASDFTIRLSTPGLFDNAIEVAPSLFLNHPKYLIRGTVQDDGTVQYKYEFNAIQGESRRKSKGTIRWEQIRDASDEPAVQGKPSPGFGPFEFEIRGWDIAPHDTQEIAERFDLKKSSIRKDIRAFKGVSVYRDGVLVLPKSEGARDWLGLDLRRVGRVGPRLSTTQLVGYVSITASDNARLEDTSDRERLASTPEVIAFEETLRAIIEKMEQERERDRREVVKERRVADLFRQLSAKELVSDVAEVANEGGAASEALPLIEAFSTKLEQAKEEIQSRFVYYSRLATIGTIAHMLVHEVRNRTTVLGSVLDWVQKKLPGSGDEKTATKKLDMGRSAIDSLERLADTFAPLANRQFRRRMRSTCVEESVYCAVQLLESEISAGRIAVAVPKNSVTEVGIDPGELDAVMLNVLANAVYWLTHKGDDDRRLEVRMKRLPGGNRVLVSIHDSGPGVPEQDAEAIFLPGVTTKPGGIGMGLTVASELVSEHGGRLALDRVGKLGGASFAFDLPLK
ncbi:MAG: ATP-binding protein [Phycisphaerales bacterium JB058]